MDTGRGVCILVVLVLVVEYWYVVSLCMSMVVRSIVLSSRWLDVLYRYSM
jgi:hypothetical protein